MFSFLSFFSIPKVLRRIRTEKLLTGGSAGKLMNRKIHWISFLMDFAPFLRSQKFERKIPQDNCGAKNSCETAST